LFVCAFNTRAVLQFVLRPPIVLSNALLDAFEYRFVMIDDPSAAAPPSDHSSSSRGGGGIGGGGEDAVRVLVSGTSAPGSSTHVFGIDVNHPHIALRMRMLQQQKQKPTATSQWTRPLKVCATNNNAVGGGVQGTTGMYFSHYRTFPTMTPMPPHNIAG
jgi:hypothetical protein